MRKFLVDGRTGVVLAVLFFFIVLFPLTKPFPYTDDWIYIPSLVSSGPLDFSSIFAPHGDHRIPLQNILHLSLLKLTGGDFRILIAANVIIMAAASIFWIMLSRIIQKETSWSEWIVPGVLLGFGFNTVVWGFNFTFVSSLFFLSLANLMWVRSVTTDSDGFNAAAFLSLALCASCGGNGHITSIIVGTGFLGAIIFTRGVRGLLWKTWFSLAVWGITVLLILILFKSSSATEMKASGQQYIHYGTWMLQSWFGVFPIQNAPLKVIFASVVLLVALGGSFLLMMRARAKEPNRLSLLMLLPVFLSALQAVIMIIAVAYSRAGFSHGWFPGLEAHYGYLVTALPLSAWIVILMLPKGLIRQASLVTLALIIGFAYTTNAKWRTNAQQDDYRRGVSVVADIMSPMSAKEVAHRHIRQFYYIEGEQAETKVSDGLSLLRKTKFWSQL